MRWLSIIGLGEDGAEGLSAAARSLLSGAAHVFGGRRHFRELLQKSDEGIASNILADRLTRLVAAGLLTGLWTAIMTAFFFARRNWLFRLDEKGWPRPKSTAQGQPVPPEPK